MVTPNQQGEYISQRELEKITGLSRPFIRKIAQQAGHKFPRNGFEVIGKLCMCHNCGCFFRRSPSKVTRAENNFCSEDCKYAFLKGPNHPSWHKGETANSFSVWITNQSAYKEWKQQVLEMYDYKCAITGRTKDIDCHHIIPKSLDPSKALDVNNGIPLCKEVHRRMHQLMREGMDFDQIIEKVQQEYKKRS